jgi:hypothetical protein
MTDDVREARVFEPPPFTPATNPTLETEEAGIEAWSKAQGVAQAVMRWRAGFHYRRVIAGELWKKGPYKNAEDYSRKRWGATAASLRSAAGVTRVYEEAKVSKQDFSCVELALIWANVAGLSPLPSDPAEIVISVPTPKGNVDKKFPECSFREIKKAIAAKKGKKSPEFPPDVSERVNRIRAALAAVLPEGHPFPIKVSIKKGKVAYAIAPLEQELFDKVIVALYGARAPVPLPLTEATATATVQQLKTQSVATAERIKEDLGGSPEKVAAIVKDMNDAFAKLAALPPAPKLPEETQASSA